MEVMQDPNIAPKIQKLIQAGVIRMGWLILIAIYF